MHFGSSTKTTPWDIIIPESVGTPSVLYMAYMPTNYITRSDICEGKMRHLSDNSPLQKSLLAEQYYFWNCNIKFAAKTVDTRHKKAMLGFPGICI